MTTRVFKASVVSPLLVVSVAIATGAAPALAESTLVNTGTAHSDLTETNSVSMETSDLTGTNSVSTDSAPTEPEGDVSTEAFELSQGTTLQTEGGVGRNFLGIGGNIGFNDDAAAGDSGFAVISKISVADNVSLRPSAIFGDDVSFLVPVTYNFDDRTIDVGANSIVPYVGGGVAISTEDDTTVSGLISAGVDYPISRQFTANAQANLTVFDETGFSILLGIGYNFDL